MRQPEYISPSAYKLYCEDPRAYYLQYIADHPMPRAPQNQPMSIGSSFDAYVKSYLYNCLFGNNDPRYTFDALFETQVEPHNRDWAKSNGQYVFEQYKQAGLLADLLSELRTAQADPRFEFEIRGVVHGKRMSDKETLHSVTLLGRPDVCFINREGHSVIVDWKVNGYCSNSAKSPNPGYVRCRSAGNTQRKQHPGAAVFMHKGMFINTATTMDKIDESWASQLSVYGWLIGEPIGNDFIVGVDQVACAPNNYPGGLPVLRFAEHRCLIDPAFQHMLFEELTKLWLLTRSDHFFVDMRRDESLELQAFLDRLYSIEKDQRLLSLCR